MNALAEAPKGDTEHEQHQDTKLFELPPIEIDETNPSSIHVTVGGSIDLDRSQKHDAEFYNRLKPGKLVTVEVTFFVKGPKTVHRRDKDGNVDAVVQTKSLVVDGVKIVED